MWLIFWFIYYDTPDQQSRLSKDELAYIRQDGKDDSSQQGELLKKFHGWFTKIQSDLVIYRR